MGHGGAYENNQMGPKVSSAVESKASLHYHDSKAIPAVTVSLELNSLVGQPDQTPQGSARGRPNPTREGLWDPQWYP